MIDWLIDRLFDWLIDGLIDFLTEWRTLRTKVGHVPMSTVPPLSTFPTHPNQVYSARVTHDNDVDYDYDDDCRKRKALILGVRASTLIVLWNVVLDHCGWWRLFHYIHELLFPFPSVTLFLYLHRNDRGIVLRIYYYPLLWNKQGRRKRKRGQRYRCVEW